MPIKVEAALVTQKRDTAEFNTDSVNINGKVLSRDIILKGYKGSGLMSGSVYFALTSSGVNGFADAAVAAFNDRAADFDSPGNDPQNVITDYFEDCKSALQEMQHDTSELAVAVLFAKGRKVVVGNSGKTKLYSVSGEKVGLIDIENKTDGFGVCTFPDVSEGDIFILAGPGVVEVMSDKDIKDICKISDGSVKKIVSLISKVSLAKTGIRASSVIAVKVQEIDLETEDVKSEFVPDLSVFGDSPEKTDETEPEVENKGEASVTADTSYTDSGKDDFIEPAVTQSTEELIKEFEEDSGKATNAEVLNIYDDDDENDDDDDDDIFVVNDDNKKKKTIIAIAAAAAILIIIIAAIFIVKSYFGNEDETTVPSDVTVEALADENSDFDESFYEEESYEDEETTKKRKPEIPSFEIFTKHTTTKKETTEGTEENQESTEAAGTTSSETTDAPEVSTGTTAAQTEESSSSTTTPPTDPVTPPTTPPAPPSEAPTSPVVPSNEAPAAQ